MKDEKFMRIFSKSSTNKGITLVELILVVSIVITLGASASSFGTGFLIRNRFRNSTNELVSSLRIAQLNSISSKEASVWGVEVSASSIRLFAADDPTFDQLTSIPGSVNITIGTVTFDNLTGQASSPTSFTVTNNIGDSKVIEVNEVGVVDVN